MILFLPLHVYTKSAHLGWMDSNINAGAVRLFSLNSLDIDHELLPIHLHDFPHLLPLVMASHYLHFVVFANGHRPDIVLLAKFFR